MRGYIVKPTPKNGRKSWGIVVSLGRDPITKKLRQKWYSHPTRKEAEAHLTEILSEVQGGTYIPPTKLPAGDFFERWLQDYAKGAVGPVTWRDYQTIIRRH